MTFPTDLPSREQAYSLLIFDWDGTLMDSSARIVKCMQYAARSVGVAEADSGAVRSMIGLSLEVTVRRLYPDLDYARCEQMVDEFRRRSLSDEVKISPLFDGVEAILRQLVEQGYDLAVATGKSRRGLDKDLLEAGVGDLFPITRTADETFSKPHPLMLQEILTDYDLDANDALMIGDTEYDLQLAANAGMDALAVSYGVHNAERLLQYQPCGLLDTFEQLPDWLLMNKNQVK
ncbi:MAG: HAD-IA family hydrolase [Thiolinea sp.]